MPATRKDVARLAGVSTATVSYVLNNSARISEATRRRVLEAARTLHYVPNQVARSLSTTSSRQLSVMVDNMKNPYYGEIVSLFERDAIEQGYFVNVCTKPQYLDTYFDSMLSRQIDGLLLLVVPDGELAERVRLVAGQGLPVAASGYFIRDAGQVSLVDPDFAGGMAQAVRFLHAHGHSRITYLSSFSRLCPYDTRVASFEAACGAVLGPHSPARVFAPQESMTSDEATGYRLATALLDQPARPTAILTTGDLMAAGCLAALHDRGVRVPEDLSVMGIDGIAFGAYTRPALTTLALDKEALAEKALRALLRQRESGDVTRAASGFSILQRASVAPCLHPSE